jgi:hypothetical protein
MKVRDFKFNFVRRCMEPGTPFTSGNLLRDVGILADGTLYNPNGYPEDVVRSAVLAAIERKKKRRSDGAKKAAATRAIRMERRVYEVARNLGLNCKYGPRGRCYICDKELGDQQSIERGIGSDCWDRVMKAITQQKASNR